MRTRPIVDTHIHFYQPSRPGGVAWPPREAKELYRDVLPAEYKALARAHGIVAAGIVEASPPVDDNAWVLDLVRGDDFFRFFVGHLQVGTPSFGADLARLAEDPRVVGIRSYQWSPTPITLDAAQRRDLHKLARRGMTLDLLSRGTTNPKPQVEALCTAVPGLRVVIDHLAGARGATPSAEWERDMRRLAERCPNLHIKFSSFYDMYKAGDGNAPWTSPPDLAAYRAHFDVLLDSFGPERLVWGSNWPVCALGGGFAEQIALAEAYLAPLGDEARDKVMFRNASAFYRRGVP